MKRFYLLLLISIVDRAIADPLIDASIKYDGLIEYDLVLSNASEEFLCVSSQYTNTYNGYIVFKDASGKELLPKTIPDSPNEVELGVNFYGPFYVLRPKESRKIELDMTNFKFKATSYQYNLKLTAYKCNEVIDIVRIKLKKDVSPISIEKNGVIDLNEDFVRRNSQLGAKGGNQKTLTHEHLHKAE